jgi:hypothetical protein
MSPFDRRHSDVPRRFARARRRDLAAPGRSATREACTLGLRQFTGWCRVRSLPLFSLRRADIETFARELEVRGRACAAVTRRRPAIAGVLQVRRRGRTSRPLPAAYVRRSRLDYESHATALDRSELGAFLPMAAPEAYEYLLGVRSYHDRNRTRADPKPTFISDRAC